MLYHKTIDDNIIIFVEINKTITYFENEIVIIRFYHQKIDDNIFFQICFRVSCMGKIKSHKSVLLFTSFKTYTSPQDEFK